MNDMTPGDDELRGLFHDAVADVEPADRLGEVRRRTSGRRAPSRRWVPLLAGAGAVAATVVTAAVVVSTVDDDAPDHDTPVASSSPSTDSTEPPATAAAGIYYVAETPTGPRLYREFQAVGSTSDPAQKVLIALQRLTTDSGPRDPDYRTLWPARSFSSVQVADDRVVVDLGTDDALVAGPGGPAEGRYGVQQAVYTAEAALSQTLPVAFVRDGRPAPTVLGVKVGDLVDRDRSFDLTAPVNITDPGERLAVDGDTLQANGTISADVAGPVRWTLAHDGDVVVHGQAQPLDITGADARATLGAPGWETEPIDISGLAPGTYVFTATVTGTGQTSDAPAQFSDTRTITVR
ncbi:GerMN domain-containing protein [Nocardioides sp. MH1]|uniref:GerMN domain-containing protein n=1 Tax=Nocardioides sp. MH1 TaxID=3242490 RepID=UPI00351FAF76